MTFPKRLIRVARSMAARRALRAAVERGVDFEGWGPSGRVVPPAPAEEIRQLALSLKAQAPACLSYTSCEHLAAAHLSGRKWND